MGEINISVEYSIKKSLKDVIKKEITEVQNSPVKIKIEANRGEFKKDIADIKNVKANVGVNRSFFQTSLKQAINSVTELKNPPKLQIEVDQNYLNSQVQKALKNLGKFATGTGKSRQKLEWEMFDPTSNQGIKQMEKLIKLQGQLAGMQQTLGTKTGVTDSFANGLEDDVKAIDHFIEQAKRGELAVEEFRAKMIEFQQATTMRSAEFKAFGTDKSAGKEQEPASLTQYFNTIKQGYNEIFRAQALLENSKSAKGSGAYNEIYENIKKIRNEVNNLENDEGANWKTAKENISQYSAAIKKNEDALRQNGDYAGSFGDKLQRFKMHLTTITSIVRAFQMLRMAIQPVVNAVTEVDTALTQLKIVTQENNSAIEAYADNIMNVADRTAGSVKDLINSTTTFARLGYDLGDASKLAEYTQMLENVGDIDETSATNAITAMIKAYGKSADDLEEIMNKLVVTGNRFPVSVSGLAEAMNNAGSMLALSTDKNIDQSLAMITAANTTIQNISKSSTGLRTIVARIRNVKAELDDLGETMTTVEYDEIVQALTRYNVALTGQDGQLRNTYDVLRDLSEAWKTMSENEQAALAKTLSGTRQQNKCSGNAEQMFTFTVMCSKRNLSNCWKTLKLFIPQRMSEQLTA